MNAEHSNRPFLITVVEDEPGARVLVKRAVTRMAERENVRVVFETYDDPQSALEAVRQAAPEQHPDVVVMDFQAAKGAPNGWVAAYDINGLTGAEVIIHTGNAEAARLQAERWPLPNVAIVVKPASDEEVADSVRAAISRLSRRKLLSVPEYQSEEFADRLTEHFSTARRRALLAGE